MTGHKYSGSVSRAFKKGIGIITPFAKKAIEYVSTLADRFYDWAENADLVEKATEFIDRLGDKLSNVWAIASKFGSAAFNMLADTIQALTGYDIRAITWDDILESINKVKDAFIELGPFVKEVADAA